MSWEWRFLAPCPHTISIDEIEREHFITPCNSGSTHERCYVTCQQPPWNWGNPQYSPSICQVQETVHPLIAPCSSMMRLFPPQYTPKSVMCPRCGIGLSPSHLFNVSVTGKSINLICDHHSGIWLSESPTLVQQSISMPYTKEQNTKAPNLNKETVCTCRSAAEPTQPPWQSKKSQKKLIDISNSSRKTTLRRKRRKVIANPSVTDQLGCSPECEGSKGRYASRQLKKEKSSTLFSPVRVHAHKKRQYKEASHVPSKYIENRSPLAPEERRKPPESEPSDSEPSAGDMQFGGKKRVHESVQNVQGKSPTRNMCARQLVMENKSNKPNRDKIYDNFSNITPDYLYKMSKSPKRTHPSYCQSATKRPAVRALFGDSTLKAESTHVDTATGQIFPARGAGLRPKREKSVRFNSTQAKTSSSSLEVTDGSISSTSTD